MRARIMFITGSEQARALGYAVEEVLTDLALAFHHSFLIKQERIGPASMQAYGSTMTQEAIDAAAECQAVLVASPNAQGMQALVQGMDCLLCCRVFHLPGSLAEHSLLKSAALPEGQLLAPLSLDSQLASASFQAAFRHAIADCSSVTELAPRGRLKALWDEMVAALKPLRPELGWHSGDLIRALAQYVAAPETLHCVLCPPAAGETLAAALSSLSGLRRLLHTRYDGENGPLIYALTALEEGQEGGNPFGLLLAAADMLRQSFGLHKEADFLLTCINNVIEAGWRTADISLPGEPRVSADAICQLLREQIALASELINR